MKKIAVVYWSGGGNTEAMAKAAVRQSAAMSSAARIRFITDRLHILYRCRLHYTISARRAQERARHLGKRGARNAPKEGGAIFQIALAGKSACAYNQLIDPIRGCRI